MNAPIKIAQVGAQPGSKQVKVVKLTKPADNQAVTIELSYDQSIKVDFSDIANEKIIIVRVGERAVILFDNGATVTLDPFFDSLHRPLANLEFEFAPGKVLTSIELAGLVPFTDDQSVLPAAGEGQPRDAGANFGDPNVDPIGPVVLNQLMPPEALGPIDFNFETGFFVPPLVITGTIFGLVEEEQFTGKEQEPSDAGIGNEDVNDVNGSDTDELPPDFLNNVTLHIEAELAPLVSGGTPPYSFTIIDPSLDADPENDFVHDTGGTGAGDRIKSQGADVKFVFVNSTTIQGWADDGGDGSLDRLVFTLTLDNATGHLEFDLNDQIDHPLASFDDGTNPQGIFEELLALNLSSVIVISDAGGQSINLGDVPGDPVVSIGVIDDTPIVDGEPLVLTVDEDDIFTFWSQGTSPFDGTGDGSDNVFDSDTFTWPAFVSGSIDSVTSIGADAHPEGSPAYSFTADAIAHMLSLGLFSKQTALPENGEPLFYSIEDTGTTLILRAFEPDPDIGPGDPDDPTPDLGDTGNIVFSLALNKFTGAFEFKLFDELIHMPPPPGGSDENTDLRSGDPDPVQQSVPYLDFGNIIQVTDYDGDTILVGDAFKIYITDDVPEADLDVDRHDSLLHDETPGDDGFDDVSFASLPAAVQAAFNAVSNPGNDPDVAGSGAIGYARDTDLITIDFGPFDTEVGADSPPLTLAVTLAIVGGDGTPSGLFTTEGFPIHLFLENGLVVGRVQGGAFNGQAAFAIHIEDDGDISLAQWLSIRHDDVNDPDESNDNGFNSGDNPPNQSPDPIQQTLAGKINAVLTVTDSDGDTATDTVGIGDKIVLEDDGPKIDIDPTHHGVVIHDETPGIDIPDNDVPGSTIFSGATTLAALFATVNPPTGDDPHVVANPIGYAQSDAGSPLFFIDDIDYGADGASGTVVYSLVLRNDASELDSGLKTTEGKSIHLFKEGNFIVGRYEDDSGDDPESDDPAVFAIAINPDTGQVSVVQWLSIKHDDVNDHDESNDNGNNSGDDLPDQSPNPIQQWINSNTLFIRATVTDGDGDFDTDTVDIGHKIIFEDDGPSVGANTTVRVDEDDLPSGNSDVKPGDDLPDPSPVVRTGNLAFDAGADGLKSLTFASMHGALVQTTGGSPVTANDASLRYFWDGATSTLYAATDITNAGTAAATAVFKVQITNPATGAYTFTLIDAVDHPTSGVEDNLQINLTYTVTDGDDDFANGTLPIDIDDDVPLIVDCNLIVNGSFEQGHGLVGNDWSIFSSITGWTWGPDNIPFEIQTGGVGGLAAQDGNALVELDGDTYGNPDHQPPQGTPDSNDSNATIQQTVATIPGQTYELTFWYAPRPGPQGDGDSSSMEVLWDGAVVHTIDSSTAPAGWQQITLYLTAADASTVLAFRGTGEENEFGAFIDNVSLCPIGAVDEDGLDTVYSNGIGDVQPGDLSGNNTVAIGSLGILWGADDGDAADAGGTQDGALTTLTGRNVVFTNANVTVEGVADLKSHGDDVTFVLSENGTKLQGVAGDGDNQRTVFEVKLLDDGSGSYRFELFDQLDHAPGDDENDIILSFDFTAVDSDGDQANGHFKVLVDDDLPIITGQVCPEVTEGQPEPGKVANFVLVLDSSGSVGGSQLTLIKNNVIDFLNDLAASGAQDVRVHIVDFDDNSKVVGTFDLIVGGEVQDDAGDAKGDQLQAAIDAVNALTSGGNEFTNYEAGLAQAKEWIEGGTVTITGAHSFNADTSAPGDDTAFVLTDSNGVRIAVVSAWEPFATNTLDDASGGLGGFGVNAGDEIDETDEMLRFDFGAFNDFDGSGEFGLAGEAVGFRGSDIVAATFSYRNFGGGDSVNYQVFYTDGTDSGLINVAPQLNHVISAPAGKLIAYIQFTVPAGSDGLIDLESVTLPQGPLLDADVNEVVFFSDGEPNRALESDGDVFSVNQQEALDESANEIAAIEQDGDGAGPDQAFNIEAFATNISGLTSTIDDDDAVDANLGGGGGENDDALILSDNGIPIAYVSAWSNATINAANLVDANNSGDGVGADGSPDAELNGTEVLRFDFGDGTDYDGAGNYTTNGFNGPNITSATFTLDDNNSSGDTVFAWTVHFVGGGSETGSQTVTNDETAVITATLPANIGKFIDYIEFNVTSGQGRVDLQSVTLAEPLGLHVLDQIDSNDAENITTNTGLGDFYAPLLASLAGGGGGGGGVVNFDLGAIVDPGADEDVSFSWKSNTTPLEDQGLKSGGTDLQYSFDGDTLIGHTGNPLDPVFTVLLNDDGTGTFTLYKSLDDTDGTADGILHVDFSGMVLATDFDLDPAVLGPQVDPKWFCFEIEVGQPLEVRGFSGGVEEDDLSTIGVYAASFNGNPDDDDADGADNDEAAPPTIGTTFFGDFAGSVVGGDGTYVFSLNPALVDGSPVALVGGGFLQSHGEDVIIDVADSQFLYGFVDSNANNTFDDGDDRLVFTFEVNPVGGTDSDWVFTLYDNVDHPTPTADSTPADEESLFLDLQDYVFVDDQSGHTATMDGTIRIIDDVPVVGPSTGGNLQIVLDETIVSDDGPTAGGDNADDDDVLDVGGPQDGINAFGSKTISGATLTSALFSTVSAGADGEKSRLYALVLKDDEGPVDVGVALESPMQATQPAFEGNPDAVPGGDPFTPYADPKIYFVQINAQTIEGHVGGAAGPLALRITIDGTSGDLTVKQFLAIDNGPDGNNHDGAFSLPSGPDGGIFVSLTVTDGDDDSASATSVAGLNLSIEDDGIDALIINQADGKIADDEGTNPLGITENDALGDVDDPEALTTLTGTLLVSIGTDGAKSYAFTDASGIPAIVARNENGAIIPFQAIYVDGNDVGHLRNVTLTWNAGVAADSSPLPGGGTLVGTAFVNGVDATGGVFTVFTLEVNNTGDYTFKTYAPLGHDLEDAPGTGDTEIEYEDNLSLEFAYKVTDGDTDYDTSTLTLTVNDDTPDVGTPDAITVENGDSAASAPANLAFSPGADGIGTVTFTDLPSGLTSGGNPILYTQVGNQLIGYTTNPGTPVFTVTVDPVANTWTFDLQGTLDNSATQTVLVGGSSFGAGPQNYQILTTGSGGTGVQVAVASGWDTNPGFNEAAWLAGGARDITHNDINGSTSGWGVDNNNFTTPEFMRFDFGTITDIDGVGTYAPPAGPVSMPTSVTFDFPHAGASDDLSYLVRYSDGSFAGATITGASITGDLVLNAPAGLTIDYVEFFAKDTGGSFKVDLVSAVVATSGGELDLAFGVQITDGDGDAEDLSLAVTVTPPAPVANGETIFINNDGADIPEWLLLLNDTNGAVDVQDGPPVSTSGVTAVTHTNSGDGNGFFDFDDDGTPGGSFNYRVENSSGVLSNPATGATATVNRTTSGTINGTAGADLIFGFTGDDNLNGGAGNDLYAFRADNDDDDTINDTGGTDRIMIGTFGAAIAGLNFESVNADSDGDGADDLSISYNGEEIDILNHYNAGASSSPGVGAIETITFVGGASYLGYALDGNPYTLNADRISPIDGTSGNDILASDSGGETLNGAGGNDLLFGNGGNDTLNGGAGDDFLHGGSGDDLLDFSDGTAAITFTLVQSGSATTVDLSGAGLGMDTYVSMEGVIGTAFADTITGSSSDDVIVGGGAGDTINLASGGDDIVRFSATTDYGDTINGFDSTGGGQDVIQFTAALNTLFDDVAANDAFAFATDNNTNNDNVAVNLNTTVEALLLDGSNSEGVTNANLTDATAVAAEFSAEFAITAAAGESALLVINDTDGNSASIWQYTESTGAAGGAGEISAGELTLITLIHSNAAIATGNLDLA